MEEAPQSLREAVSLPDPSDDERVLALVAHLITFLSTFVGPLIIYLLKKDDSKFVSHHAKESLNFQITLFIIGVILVVTIVGWIFLWVVGVVDVVFVIIATIKASEGKYYRYPFALRLIK